MHINHSNWCIWRLDIGLYDREVAGGSIIPAFLAHAIGNFLLVMAKAYQVL
jgi:hypothetical protein